MKESNNVVGSSGHGMFVTFAYSFSLFCSNPTKMSIETTRVGKPKVKCSSQSAKTI